MNQPRDPKRTPTYGGRLGHWIFRVVIRRLGLRPAYGLLALVAPYYVLLRPQARRRASYYLCRRFPNVNPIGRLWMTVRHFYHFGLVMIDQAAAGILDPGRCRVEFPDQERFYHLAQEGRGLILLTSHVGAWRSAMGVMTHLGAPVHFQYELSPYEPNRPFFEMAGQQDKFHLISPSAAFGGLVELTSALKAGECVCVMGDRAEGGRTREARFLGATAPFPVAAYHLAAATGATLVALLTHRTGMMAYRMEYTEIFRGPAVERGSRDEAVETMLRRYVACLENFLDRYPLAWLNFFDFWNGRSGN